MDILVSYDSEIVTESKAVRTDCNSIMFENIGDADALIMGNIPLEVDQERGFLNSNPREIIKNSIGILFTGSVNKQILVTRKYINLPDTCKK